MHDDPIATFYDDEGKAREITLSNTFETCTEMMKLMYFDYMIKCPSCRRMPDYNIFKETHLNIFNMILDKIHDTFADHVENTRMEVQKRRLSSDSDD